MGKQIAARAQINSNASMTLSIGNIPVNKTVKVNYEIVEAMQMQMGNFSWKLPEGLKPQYKRHALPNENEE